MAEAMKAGQNESLETLCELWLKAKCREERARDERYEIEEQMLGYLNQKTEGASTTKLDDYIVTVTNRINRTIDKGGVEAIEAALPPELRPFKTKVELDPKGLDWLAANDRKAYGIVTKWITTKAGKPGFKIVRREQAQ